MKKQFLTGLAILAAASMLCGFDSAETVDSLGQKMNEAGQDTSSASISMDMSLDALLKMSDGTSNADLSLVVSGPVDMKCTLDPYAAQLDGSITVSAMGTNETVPFQMYMVTEEDGTMTTYMQTDDTWTSNTSGDTDVADLIKTFSGTSVSFSDLEEWGLSFELAPQAADVDGVECYLLSTVIDSDSLNTLVEKASATSGEDLSANEDVSYALTALSGIQLKIEYYVDAATYLPVKIHVDLNDSDLSAFTQLVMAAMGEQAEGTSIDFALNDASIDMTVSYNDVAEITVPAEALAAE